MSDVGLFYYVFVTDFFQFWISWYAVSICRLNVKSSIFGQHTFQIHFYLNNFLDFCVVPFTKNIILLSTFNSEQLKNNEFDQINIITWKTWIYETWILDFKILMLLLMEQMLYVLVIYIKSTDCMNEIYNDGLKLQLCECRPTCLTECCH